ncbi:MAG TPA: hypothetical protein VN690_05045 [Terriglobales bacterium]|nr:hypothetical protein [Terriglobales bacterium]
MAALALEPYLAAMRGRFGGEMDLDRWWPARSRFEVVVGAVLVQNTAWANVERAIAALRRAGKLSIAGIRSLDEAELGPLIRSSGTWRVKARRLRGFVAWLDREHQGNLQRLFAQPTETARRQLLAVQGIGEETADAILLFAGRHASFVLDSYTRRIFARHRLPQDRTWAAAALPANERVYRHVHGLLVETAKRHCKKRQPECGDCPLKALLP